MKTNKKLAKSTVCKNVKKSFVVVALLILFNIFHRSLIPSQEIGTWKNLRNNKYMKINRFTLLILCLITWYKMFKYLVQALTIKPN